MCRRFRESGMTRKAFCDKHDIGLSTLGFWLRKEPGTKQRAEDKVVVVGSIEPSALRRTLRIRVKQDIVIELDLPATEQEIRTIFRSVTEG